MDFDKLLADGQQPAPIEPRELFASLPNKAEGYGYLRDVQGQVLSAWHGRRTSATSSSRSTPEPERRSTV